MSVFSILGCLETLETSQEKTGRTQECLTSITVSKVTTQLKERERSLQLQTEVKNRVAQYKLLGHWVSFRSHTYKFLCEICVCVTFSQTNHELSYKNIQHEKL